MLLLVAALSCSFFFFNDTATTEIYTLSLHDALPISLRRSRPRARVTASAANVSTKASARSGECFSSFGRDRKSTRLNSSHDQISYAVFCLKKKKKRKRKATCRFQHDRTSLPLRRAHD